MFRHKTTVLGTFLAACFAIPASAQESNTLATDCAAQFTALDTDADGFLSEAEAPREYARARIDSVPPQDTGISKDEFLTQCGTDHWAKNVPEAGAPFEGANSFTEEQARDRALAWNVTDVSALVLDDKGIWQGTGKVDGAEVSVSVDYKGNVVTGPKP